MIDLLAIAVRLRDEAEEGAIRAVREQAYRLYWTWSAAYQQWNRDIATLDGIARAVTEAGEG